MAEKKKFFNVSIPILESDLSVLGTSIQNLEDKVIKYDLTRMLKGKNFVATFIIKIKNNEAVAEIKSLRLAPSYIVRMMRNNISYVEDSFKCKAKDGNLRIKPYLLTRKRVHRSVRKALRNKTFEFVNEFCADKTRDEVFSSIISSLLQKTLSLKLKKIYPLAMCEMRVVELEK